MQYRLTWVICVVQVVVGYGLSVGDGRRWGRAGAMGGDGERWGGFGAMGGDGGKELVYGVRSHLRLRRIR